MKNVFKKLSLSLIILATSAYASAQNGLSVISGQWPDASENKMNLYEFKDGALQEVASSTLDAKGQFGFAFYPQAEGFYVIAHNPNSAMFRYVCYLKPGDAFHFKIEGQTYHLTGNNTPENKEMEKWHDFIQPLEYHSVYFNKSRSTYKEFFPLLESILPTIRSYAKAKTPNQQFNQAFEEFKRYNVPDLAIHFLNTPRSAHPQSEDYIDYYRQLDIPTLSKNISILTYPNGMNLLSNAYTARLRADKNLSKEDFLPRLKEATHTLLTGNYLSNDEIKGEFMLNGTSRCKNYDEIMDYKTKYEKYLATEKQIRRFRQILGKFDNNSAGHEAIDFKFRDINGKEVALSDFKGKVVYIDVWATWCGPCKGEIPYMGKLEEEYAQNKNIVFISVSIDQEKDLDKWKAMVKEKNMKGVQLFAGDRKQDISGPYKVNAIPRFMIVGKDGKMITSQAPRPSSTEIRTVLNDALKR